MADVTATGFFGIVRGILREQGLATLLVLMLITSSIYDRYVWTTTMLQTQRDITLLLTGVPDAVERARTTAAMAEMLVADSHAMAETHRQILEVQRQQAVLLEHLIYRLAWIERGLGLPPGGGGH